MTSLTRRLFPDRVEPGTGEDSGKTSRRRRDIVNVTALAGSVSTFCILSTYAALGLRDFLPLILALAAFCVIWAATPLVDRLGREAAAWYLTGTVASGNVIFCAIAGTDFGGHYFYLAAPPVVVMGFGADRKIRAFLIAGGFLVLFLLCELGLPARTGTVPFSDELATMNLAFCVVAGGLINLLAALYAFHRIDRTEEALQREYRRSEDLLLNLMPASIARRLKEHPGEILADHFEQVTILFADIVGFTARAERLRPRELVGLLNRLFSRFDDLVERHGLEKIKTVGDAYMVAGGMPERRPDHARATAELALEMIAATQALSRDAGEPIDIRIGIHVGPAVAGVIGTRKLFYDVWGDTVNTASRLESHGVAGRIQVTPEAAAVLGPGYVFERRGTVVVKGKGEMELMFLAGRGPGPNA